MFFFWFVEEIKFPEPLQLISPHISFAKLGHMPRPNQSLPIGNGTAKVCFKKVQWTIVQKTTHLFLCII